MNNPY
jgi:hypothetical protein